jgi:hypothetical protein
MLVLGRPGSGCTTFLKTVANIRVRMMMKPHRLETDPKLTETVCCGQRSGDIRRVYIPPILRCMYMISTNFPSRITAGEQAKHYCGKKNSEPYRVRRMIEYEGTPKAR